MRGGTVTVFRVFAILRRGLAISARKVVPFGLVTIVVMSPYYLFFWSGASVWLAELSVPKSADWVSLAIEDMLTFVAAAVLCHATIGELRGGGSNIGESLRFGIRLFPPVTCIAILNAIVFVIGFGLPLHFIRGIEILLFIVPALFLTTIWWVVIPAAVVEQPGVIGSFVRSAQLTAGYRWRVFCVLVAVRGTYFAISMFAPFALVWALGTEGIIAASFGVSLAFGAIMVGFALVEAVLVVVTYHDLRIIEDGGETEWIASKFD